MMTFVLFVSPNGFLCNVFVSIW